MGGVGIGMYGDFLFCLLVMSVIVCFLVAFFFWYIFLFYSNWVGFWFGVNVFLFKFVYVICDFIFSFQAGGLNIFIT